MKKMQIKNKKLLYHLTRLENLDSIIKYGLLSRKVINEKNVSFGDVANQGIISKRTELGLDRYIPFHFHPYSSFDNIVKNTYDSAQFIYICIKRELARYNKFKILIKHPLTEDDCKLLEYDEGLTKIDWDAMETYGTEDIYIKHVKMAECLTDSKITADCFHCIYVSDEETKELVKNILIKNEIKLDPPFVDIQKWC